MVKSFNCFCCPNDIEQTIYENKTIHFLSVDTEGAEIDIFRDFTFEHFDIRVIVVEVSRDSSTAIDNLFLPQGYVLVAHFIATKLQVNNLLI